MRFSVFERDGFRCVYCGRPSGSTVLQVDHVIPLRKGGTDSFDNYVTACEACNDGKGDRLLTNLPNLF